MSDISDKLKNSSQKSTWGKILKECFIENPRDNTRDISSKTVELIKTMYSKIETFYENNKFNRNLNRSINLLEQLTEYQKNDLNSITETYAGILKKINQKTNMVSPYNQELLKRIEPTLQSLGIKVKELKESIGYEKSL